jgi:hypothetical protein
MNSLKSISRILAVAILALAANVYASADYYLKIDGIKGERARIVRCPDGTCAIEDLSAGSFTVTFCDSKGNPIKTPDNFKLNCTFTPTGIRESPTKSSVRESPTKASTGATTITTSSTEVVSPRDVATGQSSGKRQHGTVKIVKEWDANTPMLRMETPSEGENNAVVRWTLEVRVQRIEMK